MYNNTQSIEMFGDVEIELNLLYLFLTIKHNKEKDIEETVEIIQTGNYSVVCVHEVNINVDGHTTTIKNESDTMHIVDCRMETAFNDVHTIRILLEGYEKSNDSTISIKIFYKDLEKCRNDFDLMRKHYLYDRVAFPQRQGADFCCISSCPLL